MEERKNHRKMLQVVLGFPLAMASRFGATIEHVIKDTGGNPDVTDVMGQARAAVGWWLAKFHAAISGITPSIIGLVSSKEYNVVPRDGVTAATRAAVHNTLNVQWFEKGPARLLNIVPKALTAVVELPDGVVRDGIQLVGGGRKNDGYIVEVAA